MGTSRQPAAPEAVDGAGGMEAQLADLYAERELLERELNISDAAEIVAMVRSLEGQLIDLYQERELSSAGDHNKFVSTVREMGSLVGDMYQSRTLVVEQKRDGSLKTYASWKS